MQICFEKADSVKVTFVPDFARILVASIRSRDFDANGKDNKSWGYESPKTGKKIERAGNVRLAELYIHRVINQITANAFIGPLCQ